MFQAECCGLAFSDGREFSLGVGEQIPIFCCKNNPLTEPSLLSNENCTKRMEPSLRHRTVVRLMHTEGIRSNNLKSCSRFILNYFEYIDSQLHLFKTIRK